MKLSLLLFAVSGTAAISGGCGLISSDVSDFDLAIKDRTFTIDAETWMIDGAMVPDFLMTDCSSAPTVCDSAAKQACSGCSGACVADRCELRLEVGLFNQVDLMMDNSELNSINQEKGISVVVDGATYQIDAGENSLNVGTPELTIFVAPASVTDWTDPAAKPIGTVPPIATGQTTSETDIEYTETGKADLSAAITNFTTPFNLLVGATLDVMSGDPIPAGSLTAIVRIKAHAHAF